MAKHFPLMVPGATASHEHENVFAPYDGYHIATVEKADLEGVRVALDTAYGLFRNRDHQREVLCHWAGLIKWHQLRHFGRPSHIDFNNPDLVKYAESFGAKGYRVEDASELLPILKQAIADDTVAVIDCPVDYSENMKLTEKLGKLVCPI